MNNHIRQSNLKNSIKNLIGTIFYYFCQWLTLLFIIHIAGYTVSGEYSIVISFTNLFAVLSSFGIRSFQLSDAKQYFSPQQYTGTYIITSGLALACFFITLPFTGYSFFIKSCCFIYMIYKLLETFSSYIITYLQLKEEYTCISISFCIKGIFPLIAFSFVLYFTRTLFLSLLTMSFLYLFIIIFYDLRKSNIIFTSGILFKETLNIIKNCLPLMLSALVLPLMLFFIRHSIGKLYGITELGYFSVFTMVIVILSTMSGSIYIVLLPKFSEKYVNQKKKKLFIQFTL